MRDKEEGGQGRRVSFASMARIASPAFAIALGFFFGAQGPATALESHTISTPFAAPVAAPASSKPALPKAPAQVAMPAPPPIKYFPGLEEPLVATGPVT